MNIVFFGTSEFAIPSLRALAASRHKISALITQPDRKRGRNLKVSSPPTKVLAQAAGIPVFQPADVSSIETIEYLNKLNADLFVVTSFGQILKKEVLSIPRLFAINLHASLLPRYRGAAPTNWAIINGESSSGVTIIKMNDKMDAGDIISNKEVAIESRDTNITLSEALSEIGAHLLLETVDLIEDNINLKVAKQDDSKVTYAPKLKKEDGLIDWDKSAVRIHNLVRGLLPWPGAYTHYEGKILKVLKAETVDYNESGARKEDGEVVDIIKDKGIIVRAGIGYIALQYLQLEGRKTMDASSFIRGHRIAKGYKLR